jgi:hypothetical protein
MVSFGFDLLAICRKKNLRAFQVLIGVNVIRLLLLRFFAGAFLSGGVSDILRRAWGRGNCDGSSNSCNAKA